MLPANHDTCQDLSKLSVPIANNKELKWILNELGHIFLVFIF
jgi:hypothetical protein